MKHLLYFSLVLIGFPGLSMAQISDDEPSKNLLAVHCAVSGGKNVNNYEEYGRKLAKTIALLSPYQQKNVFGYLPQPAAAPEVPDYNPEFHGSLGGSSSSPATPVGSTENSGAGSNPTENPIITDEGSPENGKGPKGQKFGGSFEDWLAGILGWIDGMRDAKDNNR